MRIIKPRPAGVNHLVRRGYRGDCAQGDILLSGETAGPGSRPAGRSRRFPRALRAA